MKRRVAQTIRQTHCEDGRMVIHGNIVRMDYPYAVVESEDGTSNRYHLNWYKVLPPEHNVVFCDFVTKSILVTPCTQEMTATKR